MNSRINPAAPAPDASSNPYSQLVQRTIQACRVAKEAAGEAAEGIATGTATLLATLRKRENELDLLDMQIDDGVTTAITQVEGPQARELLACMKIMIGVERIGDLLLSFGSSAEAAGARIEPQDRHDLTHMASVLEKMLGDVAAAFLERDLKKAVDVLRADAEMDRLRNLIFMRHIENPRTCPARPACRSSS